MENETDSTHIDIDVPTPDPQPPAIEHVEQEVADVATDRVRTLERRMDEFASDVAERITRAEHEASLERYAPRDHDHDERYVTREQYDRDTMPVEVPAVEETTHVVAPLDDVEEQIEHDIEQEHEDYSKLGIRW